ncbi:MAG: DUF4321 domain-containing protein [Clostridia bacterium]|nr:DUF4321 domain-containing protein [Clostridia bacterium]
MKSKVITVIVVLAGLVLGSFLGEITKGISWLSWLGYGQVVGIPNFDINLYSVNINFGLTFNCTIASILGLLIGLVIYRKLIK